MSAAAGQTIPALVLISLGNRLIVTSTAPRPPERHACFGRAVLVPRTVRWFYLGLGVTRVGYGASRRLPISLAYG